MAPHPTQFRWEEIDSMSKSCLFFEAVGSFIREAEQNVPGGRGFVSSCSRALHYYYYYCYYYSEIVMFGPHGTGRGWAWRGWLVSVPATPARGRTVEANVPPVLAI